MRTSKCQVRSGDLSGFPGQPDHLTRLHLLAAGHVHAAQVPVHREKVFLLVAEIVPDGDSQPVRVGKVFASREKP